MGSLTIQNGAMEKTVSVEYEFPDPLVKFANHMVVQRDNDSFRISFFQIDVPILIGSTPAELQHEANKLNSVKAICVANVVVTASRMAGIIEALQSNRIHSGPEEG